VRAELFFAYYLASFHKNKIMAALNP